MSITAYAFGQNTLWNFVDTSGSSPNWNGVPIDSSSNASVITSTFTENGHAVKVEIDGVFPSNVAGYQSIGGLVNALPNTSITAFKIFSDGKTLTEQYASDAPISLSFWLQVNSGSSAATLAQAYNGNDVFYGSTTGNSDNDNTCIGGYAGNDTYHVGASSGGSIHPS